MELVFHRDFIKQFTLRMKNRILDSIISKLAIKIKKRKKFSNSKY